MKIKNNILIFTSKLTRGWWIDSWAILLWQKLIKEWYNINYLTIYDYEKENLIKENYFTIWEKYNKNNIFKRIFDIFYRAYFLAKFCKKNNINRIISASTIPNTSAILSKIFWNKAKIISSIHLATKNLWKIEKNFIKLFYKNSDYAVTVSKEEEYFLKKYINKKVKIKTIYNSIAPNKSSFNKQKNSKIKFINIWRLSNQKNHKLLLEIFEEYYKKNNNSELIILWDWELKNKLINFKDTLKSKDNIHFLWIKKNIYEYLNNSDYFLMTSKLEWFPMVFIEAMSCWLPIITHDFETWAKELIRWIKSNNFRKCEDTEITERWILIPFNDKEKYIKALEKLNTINFNKKEIKNYADNNFNIDNNIKQWIQIIEEK